MANGRICSIDGCGNKHDAKGYCSRHLYHFRKCGDPLGGRRGASPGEPLRWVAEHASYEGDDCIVWPFEKSRYGYGVVKHDGKRRVASRVMCEAVHGAAPAEGMDAAHSCGNGHLGCMNPTHLRWATRKQNIEDMRRHGSFIVGILKKSKIHPDTVVQIRSKIGIVSQTSLAKSLGLRQSEISRIQLMQRFAWVE